MSNLFLLSSLRNLFIRDAKKPITLWIKKLVDKSLVFRYYVCMRNGRACNWVVNKRKLMKMDFKHDFKINNT